MRRARRCHLVTSLITSIALLAPPAAIATAAADDPCTMLPPDLLTSVLGSDGAPFGDGATWCTWQGALTAVSTLLDPSGLDALRATYPGGEDVEVGGGPAYLVSSSSPEFSLDTVLVPLGERTLSLTVSSSDPAVDVDAVTLQLAEAALSGVGSTSSAAGAAASPGPSVAVPAAVASPAAGGWCDGLTAEAVSAAVGVGVTALPNATIEGSCGWIGGPVGEEIAIEVNRLDASSIEDLAAGFGGMPVDGLPFTAWWASDFDVLHVLAEDLAFHVALASGGLLDDADAQARAIAVAEAFVASS